MQKEREMIIMSKRRFIVLLISLFALVTSVEAISQQANPTSRQQSDERSVSANSSSASAAASDQIGHQGDNPQELTIKGYHLGMSVEEMMEHYKYDNPAKWVKKHCKNGGEVTTCAVDSNETFGNAIALRVNFQFKNNRMYMMVATIDRQGFPMLASALQERFGEPRTSEDSYQNGLGNVFKSAHLEWSYGQGSLTLDEMAKSFFGSGVYSDLMQKLSELTLVDRAVFSSLHTAKPDL
jgi:hypothetical protein